MGEGGEGTSLEYTPTWVVAGVCTVIVAISLAVERLIHFLGTYLKNKKQKSLFEALQKVKEELMLLGFISLLLTVSQGTLVKMCVKQDIVSNMLPCKFQEEEEVGSESNSTSSKTTSHFQKAFRVTARRLLSEGAASQTGYCSAKDKVPLLSLEALHQLHIFIFVLAIVHVTFCVLTVVFGGLQIRKWKDWEDSIAKETSDQEHVLKKKVTHVHQHAFIRERFLGFGKNSILIGWAQSFLKQFYGSVTKSDYLTLRLGFIMTHCKSNPKFNFHKYMIRALEDDFKHVVGISWYLWIFVVIFLLLNVNGWHTYFWIAFIPFGLLLALGTKLEHVIIQLAHEVAEKHVAVEGDLVVKPSDDHFWFHKPQLILFLIHFILFQNAFEIGFFFWIWIQYGFNSCIMGKIIFIVPRLVIGVFVQILCSYSTLPLYAIVTQMGTCYKKAIFDEHVQQGLVGWANKVKRKKALREATSNNSGLSSAMRNGTGHGQASPREGGPGPSVAIEMGRVLQSSARGEIQSSVDNDGSK